MVVLVGGGANLIEMAHNSLLPLLDRFVYWNRWHFYIPNFGHDMEFELI